MPFNLAHSILGADEAEHTALVLHGALGSQQNWRGFARGMVRRFPRWRIVLADLRHHGDSHPAPPPNTLAACAEDVARLIDAVGGVNAVIGHSMGGKVGLAYAAGDGGPVASSVRQVWLLDSLPGAQLDALAGDHEIYRVLRATESLELPVARRDAIIAPLKSAGLSDGICRWMTTNLKLTDDGYELTLNTQGIRQLMDDYFRRDLWPVLEEPRQTLQIHLVVAQDSDRFSPEVRQRARAIPAESQVHTHLLADSGHWVHIDNPKGLGDLLERQLFGA